jgi:transcriptional repressor NrdR
LRCPNPRCRQDDEVVLETRQNDDASSIRRRRQCNVCGFRFSTYETVNGIQLVRKRRGGTEPFDVAKLRTGVELSLAKLTDGDVVVSIVGAILDEFRDDIVDTELLGEAVERHLAAVHPIAYLRFASVFRHWSSADDFRRAVSAMSEAGVLIVRKRSRPGVADRSQTFDPVKVRRSIAKAVKQTGLDFEDDIDELTAKVVEDAAKRARGMVIESVDIGKLILRSLQGRNEVAYLRYLSVFAAFQLPSEFESAPRKATA